MSMIAKTSTCAVAFRRTSYRNDSTRSLRCWRMLPKPRRGPLGRASPRQELGAGSGNGGEEKGGQSECCVGAARTNHRSELLAPPSAKQQPGQSRPGCCLVGLVGDNGKEFFRKRGRVGVNMAYREWGGCCRNPGGVPSAGLRRDKILGLYR